VGEEIGMHELPITESILKIVLKHARANDVKKVKTIHLRIGRLSDLEDEWLQRYFDYLSKGTLAEGAKIKIERTPIVMKCDACSASYEWELSKMGDIICPACGGKRGTLLSGREYTVKEMEAE
jgi:hydrogenase nickel incorporation protein HypA/HybF